MAEVLRVVSAPVDDRDVVVDLLSSVIRLSAFSAPAPRLRRASVSSFQVDGSVDAALAWEVRELTISLAVLGASEDEAASVSQLLGRVFSQPCWLEFQSGTTEPVFFRTRASALDTVEDFGPSNPGVRVITVVIPADPFAYGLPESDTILVPNDPSDGGMRFVLSGVKGDAPAPLRLECELGAGVSGEDRRLLASSTASEFHHVPVTWSNDFAPDLVLVSDATAIGGQYAEVTFATGDEVVQVAIDDVSPGDYRVLMRCVAADGGSVRAIASPDLADIIPGRGPFTPLPSVWSWLDLGVMRLPHRSRQTSAWEPPATGAANVSLTLRAAAGKKVHLDHLALVPAPGADGALGRLMTVATPWRASSDLVVSGETEAAWTSARVYGYDMSVEVAGGFPVATPGTDNLVTFVRSVFRADVPVTDSKTANTEISWSYHPRYLTIRGD